MTKMVQKYHGWTEMARNEIKMDQHGQKWQNLLKMAINDQKWSKIALIQLKYRQKTPVNHLKYNLFSKTVRVRTRTDAY